MMPGMARTPTTAVTSTPLDPLAGGGVETMGPVTPTSIGMAGTSMLPEPGSKRSCPAKEPMTFGPLVIGSGVEERGRGLVPEDPIARNSPVCVPLNVWLNAPPRRLRHASTSSIAEQRWVGLFDM